MLNTLASFKRSLKQIFVGLALSALFFIAIGCGGGNKYVPTSTPKANDTVSLSPQDWQVLYSPGMPSSPTQSNIGAWYFDFPNAATGSVHYVQVPYHQTVSHTTLSMTFRIDETNAVYQQTDSTNPNPAALHLFLERKGDDLTDPSKTYYRWWSSPIKYNFSDSVGNAVVANGNITITVPLTYDQWTPVTGPTDAGNFQAALDNLGWVGVTFGGQSFFGHGVSLASGQSRFTLVDYSIK